MKWSNHANLAAYGLELVGWPPAVPPRNPSALSAAQNQAVLDALAAGRMWFRSTNPPPPSGDGAPSGEVPVPEVDEEAIFEDTIDFDAVGPGGAEAEVSKRDINCSITCETGDGILGTPAHRRDLRVEYANLYFGRATGAGE